MAQHTITALFDSHAQASSAVSALEGLGLTQSDISIVSNNEGDRVSGIGNTGTGTASGMASELNPANASPETKQGAETGAGTGASIGTLIGGGAGLLAGLGLLAIPGVGPVVAAGWLVATVTGAGIGAAAGGLAGALTGAGVNKHDAHAYEEGVRRGGTLLTVRAEASLVDQVTGILQDKGAVDIDERSATWRNEGWTAPETATAGSVVGTRPDTGFVDRGGRVRIGPSAARDPYAVDVERTPAADIERSRQA